VSKIALAFVAGTAAGWLLAVTTHAPEVGPALPALGSAAKRPDSAAARTPRAPLVHAAPPAESPAPAPAAEKTKKAKPVKPPAPQERQLSDAEVLALLSHENAQSRQRGQYVAATRGLLSVAQLLDHARGDPDHAVRADALGLAVGHASDDDGTLALVANEVLAWARDVDSDRRSLGLQFLDETGAHGAALGRELLDQGGLSADLYQAAVHTLVAARRFERLAPEEMDPQSYDCLISELNAGLDADASIAPQIAEVLRSAGPPTSYADSWNYCVLAIHAGAPDLVRDVARSSSRPLAARGQAFQLLFDDPGEARDAVALAAEILTDPASPAGRRRAALDAIGWNLLQQGEPGLAVLRRVADHDANAWVRELARDHLAAAEAR
jgi:hypothetical protein